MGPVKRIAAIYARLIGLMVVLLGTWMVSANVVEQVFGENTYDPAWMLVVVIGFGLVGVVGGVTFLLGWDGPPRFRSSMTRTLGWLGMMFMAFLPWSFTFLFFPLVALSGLTLLVPVDAPAPTPARSG
jgi:hypothetical protein